MMAVVLGVFTLHTDNCGLLVALHSMEILLQNLAHCNFVISLCVEIVAPTKLACDVSSQNVLHSVCEFGLLAQHALLTRAIFQVVLLLVLQIW